MHPTYVKIVRVFPLLRTNYRGQKSTQFGFATETKRYYDLHINGWPVIEAGMKMTAILEKPGDWQSLQGWVNHTSGEVAAPTRGNWIFQLTVSSLMSIIICSSWSSLHPLIMLVRISCSAWAFCVEPTGCTRRWCPLPLTLPDSGNQLRYR